MPPECTRLCRRLCRAALFALLLSSAGCGYTIGAPFSQEIGQILLHLFNHQTHHRGQAHACCSILTGSEPPPLDLLLYQRGVPAPELAL